MQQKSTLYELIGVQPTTQKKDILAAYKKIVAGIHPDKNKDQDSKKCTQGMYLVFNTKYNS